MAQEKFPLTDEQLERFASTLRRPIMKRRTTFVEWLQSQNIDVRNVASSDEYCTYVAQTVFQTPNRTRAQAGKENALTRKARLRYELLERYTQEVPEEKVGDSPLDMSRESDRAYARIRYRRMNMRNSEMILSF